MTRSRRRVLAAVAVVPFVLGVLIGGVISRTPAPQKSAQRALEWAAQLGPAAAHHAESDDFVLMWAADAPDSSATSRGVDPPTGVLLDRLERYYATYVRAAGIGAGSHELQTTKIAVVLTSSAVATPDSQPASAADDARDASGTVHGALGVLEIAPDAADEPSWDVAHALATILLDLGSSTRTSTSTAGTPTPNADPGVTSTLEQSIAAYLATSVVPRAVAGVDAYVGAENLRWGTARHGETGWLLLQYVADHDGVAMVGRIWSGVRPGEDPLETYRRVSGISSAELARRLADVGARTVTWDIANQADVTDAVGALDPAVLAARWTPVDATDAAAGHYRVASAFAPAAGGLTVVRLVPEPGAASVKVRLRGHVERRPGATWAFGFVAVRDGVARYGRVVDGADAELELTLEPGEREVYLVVAAVPANLPELAVTDGYPSAVRYPYEFRVVGAVPDEPTPPAAGGHRHANGGGWVDDRATVAPEVFVGEHAVVGARVTVSGPVRIEGRARVEPDASVSGSVVLRDNAVVRSGATLGGGVVVGGDAVVGFSCTSGVYVRFDPHRTCDGRDPDADVNVEPVPFETASIAIQVAPVRRRHPGRRRPRVRRRLRHVRPTRRPRRPPRRARRRATSRRRPRCRPRRRASRPS